MFASCSSHLEIFPHVSKHGCTFTFVLTWHCARHTHMPVFGPLVSVSQQRCMQMTACACQVCDFGAGTNATLAKYRCCSWCYRKLRVCRRTSRTLSDSALAQLQISFLHHMFSPRCTNALLCAGTCFMFCLVGYIHDIFLSVSQLCTHGFLCCMSFCI